MSALVALTAFGFTIPSLVISTNAAADTLQMSSDNLETGWYPNEPQLAPSAVTGGNFGQLFNTQLTGQVYAQPLVAQPTVLAVTEKDYAYGLDSTTGAITWQRNFGPPADPLVQTNCGDIGANNGPNVDYANGGSMKEWGATLDGVLKLDFDTVIPGHGPVSKRQYLIDYRDVATKLPATVISMVRDGKSKDDIAKVFTTNGGLWANPNVVNKLDQIMAELKN